MAVGNAGGGVASSGTGFESISVDEKGPVVVILCAMTKQGESKVNCQDMSQLAQGGDKSRQTCQSLQSVLELMSFVQGPVEVSRSG